LAIALGAFRGVDSMKKLKALQAILEPKPPTCAFCGLDMTGRTHTTAMVAHALEECRIRMRVAVDALSKEVEELKKESGFP
jgi:UDP-N-acetylmuramate-alanine ligase